MNIVVSSRHMDLTPALKAHAEAKATKLLKHFDRITEIEVVLDNTKGVKDEIAVEIIVYVEHSKEFVAHLSDGDAYSCINACVEKMERQLSDHKKELRNRKHADGGATIRHS